MRQCTAVSRFASLERQDDGNPEPVLKKIMDLFDQTMVRVLKVAPNEMTFEDGMRKLEILRSFAAIFGQAENEQPMPDAGKLVKFDGDAERFIAVRSELITLWQRMVQEYQRV